MRQYRELPPIRTQAQSILLLSEMGAAVFLTKNQKSAKNLYISSVSKKKHMYLKRNNELGVLLLYLGDYRRRFYLREISTKTKIPLKTAYTVLSSLEKKKILKTTVEGKNKYFSLNRENIETKWYLLHAELYKTQLFVEKYPLFKTFLKSLEAKGILIIFGSFAKWTADKYSDCDFLLISEQEEKLPIHLLPYETHKVEMLEESYKKAAEKGEALIKEIEENHVVLNNHSAYVDILWRQRYGK